MFQIGISVKAAIFSQYFVDTYPSSVQAAFKGAIDSSAWIIEAISRKTEHDVFVSQLSAAWM